MFLFFLDFYFVPDIDCWKGSRKIEKELQKSEKFLRLIVIKSVTDILKSCDKREGHQKVLAWASKNIIVKKNLLKHPFRIYQRWNCNQEKWVKRTVLYTSFCHQLTYNLLCLAFSTIYTKQIKSKKAQPRSTDINLW